MEVNNLDKLVKAVTKSVLTKLDIDVSVIGDKSCLILMQNAVVNLKEYLNYIKESYDGYELYLGSNHDTSKSQFDLSGFKLIDPDTLSIEFINVLSSVEIVIVLGLKLNQMKAIVDSNDEDDVNHIVLSSLMANKKVDIVINSNGTMINKISKHISSLKKMGINVNNIQKVNNEVVEVKLITEKYVNELSSKGISTIVLKNNQLITPLAKDRLRELKIEVHTEEVSK